MWWVIELCFFCFLLKVLGFFLWLSLVFGLLYFFLFVEAVVVGWVGGGLVCIGDLWLFRGVIMVVDGGIIKFRFWKIIGKLGFFKRWIISGSWGLTGCGFFRNVFLVLVFNFLSSRGFRSRFWRSGFLGFFEVIVLEGVWYKEVVKDVVVSLLFSLLLGKLFWGLGVFGVVVGGWVRFFCSIGFSFRIFIALCL